MKVKFPKQKDQEKQNKPLLINPITKTWYEWDNLKNEYIDTGKSIL